MRRARALAIVAAVALSVAGAHAWRVHAVRAAPLLPVSFDHRDHAAVRCVECHHNYVDGTGMETCYACHKQRPDLALSIQEDFHDFCRGCHLEGALAGTDTGPLRRCAQCHAHAGPKR